MNPLLNITDLVDFTAIQAEHIEPAVTTVLQENRKLITQLLAKNQEYTWENLVAPIEQADDRLNQIWSAVGHLNSVVNSEAIRQAYNACLPKLSDYANEIGQNHDLYLAFKSIKESTTFNQLSLAQQKIIDNELLDFQLAGVALAKEAQASFREISKQLSSLTTKFEENILDARNNWFFYTEDVKVLQGIPEISLAQAQLRAKSQDKIGYQLNLEFPCYYAVMNYADDRKLREKFHYAYVTCASAIGPNAGKWDNSQVMVDILNCRHQLAKLLGYDNYAQRSLVKKMADSPSEVMDFLQELVSKTKQQAEKEYAELQQFAKSSGAQHELAAWDIGYYAEKLKQEKYDISDDMLRPYFPEEKVLSGLFAITKKLYNVTIRERTDVSTWHDDVRFFDLYDEQNALKAQFYLDLYARPNKRGGAWMDECRVRRSNIDGEIQTPIAYLTCNFNGPTENKPALFTHDEVVTLFHEFGHGLHHMMTAVHYAGVAGINGVAWDAVELPSQFYENWCWQQEAIPLISAHYQTGEPLPNALLEKLLAARNFQSAMQMVRQLEFALFDFRLHLELQPELVDADWVQKVLTEVRQQVSVVPVPEFNRFQHGFSHIFAGGYAAGYYSYKWAEVLSADAFSLFEEKGIFDQQTGQAFLDKILSKGGEREAMELFINFRGRPPKIDALLEHSGIQV